MSALLIHAGQKRVSLDELKELDASVKMKSKNIPYLRHYTIINQIKTKLEALKQTYLKAVKHPEAIGNLWDFELDIAISKGGNTCMAIFQIEIQEESAENTVLVVCNSYGKGLKTRIFSGAFVPICTNMLFLMNNLFECQNCGEIHEKFMDFMSNFDSHVFDSNEGFLERIKNLQNCYISDQQIYEILGYLVICKDLPSGLIKDIWKEYKNPRHEQFKEPNPFNFLMAITECLKMVNDIDRFVTLSKEVPSVLCDYFLN
ncbi:hypothetical protein [Gloeothece verrucosa]|uniref:Uncharacterized protein n=1 Tax=Gloeothece verrucosa (strain PCC 7822) TaxID=497965 RepID=E0UHR2_GLOV7|nr:hypothetical protein [Gloeothece verrucosa]ADN13319.1 hypothetical protein Cyan7822_1318 [Gloeothece verrucosa PCC 7822]